MNIFYIGPFQNNNALGYLSSFILENLCDIDTHRIHAFPIYSGIDNSKISTIPYFRFNDIKEYPDINIQHSSISSIYIDYNSKNYFIPIHPLNADIPKQYMSKLKFLDKILVYSDFEIDKFIKAGIDKDKLVKIKPPTMQINQPSLDLGIYNDYKKYYFIGDFHNNQNIIKSLITNFLSISPQLQKTCLLIASESDAEQRKKIIEFYEQEKQNLHSKIYEDKILLLIDNVGLDRIHGLHSCGDVYLCLNDGSYPITDIAAAKSSNSHIVQYPTEGLDIEQSSANISYKITNIKIRDIFLNTAKNIQSKDKYIPQSIEKILC